MATLVFSDLPRKNSTLERNLCLAIGRVIIVQSNNK